MSSSQSNASTHESKPLIPQKRTMYYPCPGHSPGHTAFYVADDEVLLCGDAIMNVNNKLTGPTPLSTPDPVLAHTTAFNMISTLPNEAMVLPSHDSSLVGVPKRRILEEFYKVV